MAARVLLVAMAIVSVSGCFGAGGVGDPCLPAEPAPPPPCGDGGCFLGTEVYLETRSLQCRTHVCIVDHWDQADMPSARNERAYCTCRCDGAGDPTTLCKCPDGFTCQPVFATGDPGVRGSYCLRTQ